MNYKPVTKKQIITGLILITLIYLMILSLPYGIVYATDQKYLFIVFIVWGLCYLITILIFIKKKYDQHKRYLRHKNDKN